MSLSKVTLVILLAIFAIPILPTHAQDRGFVATQIVANKIQAESTIGDSLLLTTYVQDVSSNNVSAGELSTYDLEMISLGQGPLNEFTSNETAIVFSIPETIQAAGFRLPLYNFQSSMSTISWNLIDASGTTVISGKMVKYDAQDMIVMDSALYFLFDSHQTANYGEVNLIANTSYTLKVNLLSGMNFTYFSASSSSATVDNIPIQAEILRKNSMITNSVSSSPDVVSLSMNTTGLHKIVRYYSNQNSEIYYPSIDIQEVHVSSNSNLAIDTSDVAEYRFSKITLNATVTYLGQPVFEQSVRYSVKINDQWNYIASNKTDTNGHVQQIVDLSYIPGSYSFKVETQYLDDIIFSVSNLIVYEPISSLVNLDASGSYGSGPADNTTIVVVSGYIVDQNTAVLPDFKINVSSTTESAIAVSNSSGYFSAEFGVDKPIGFYSDFFRISSPEVDYTFQEQTLDMQISLGHLSLVIPQYQSRTSQQNEIQLQGNITNPSGRVTHADVKLEYLGSAPISMGWSNGSTTFTFGFNNSYFIPSSSGLDLSFGRHTFRLTAYKPDFSIEIKEIYVDIVPDNVTITREGILHGGVQVPLADNFLKTSQFMTLNVTTSNTLEFRILNSMDEGIGNTLLKIEVLSGDTWELVNYTRSVSDGTVSLDWMIQRRHISISFGTFRVSSINENFTASISYFYFFTEKVAVNYQMSVVNASYGLQTKLDLTATDFNNAVLPNMPLKIQFDGQLVYIQTDSSGAFQLSKIFSSAGTFDISITLNNYYYYFSQDTQNLSIEIQKAEYTIALNSVQVSAGSKLMLDAEVKDRDGYVATGLPISLIYNGSIVFNGSTDGNGLVSYLVSSNYRQPLGDYVYTWMIYADQNYLSAMKTQTVTVDHIGLEIAIEISDYFYNSPNTARIIASPVVSSPSYSVDNLEIQIQIGNFTTYLSTDTSGIINYKMPFDLLPDTYNLSASYAGGSLFTESSSISSFRVLGSTIDLTWIEEPSSIAYGDSLSFSFRLSANGVVLKHINVTTSLGSSTWLSTTDNQGVYRFNRTILEVLENSDLRISVQQPIGYEDLVINRTISVQKIGLNVLSDNPYHVNYTDSIDVRIQVVDELYRSVPNAKVTVFYRVNNGSDWIYLLVEQTDNQGYLTITVDTSQLGGFAGQSISLKFEIQHPNYLSNDWITIFIKIQSEEMDFSLSAPNATYYSKNSVIIKVTDDDLQPLEGKKVVIESSVRGIIANGTTGKDGNVSLLLESRGDSNEIYTVTVYDYTGNFVSFSKLLNIQFQKSQGIIASSFVNYEGQPGIELDLRTNSFYIIDAQITVFYSDDNVNWILLGSGLSTNGSFVFDTKQSTAERYYRIVLPESDTFLGDVIEVKGILYTIQFDVHDTYVQYSDGFRPNVTLVEDPGFKFSVRLLVDGQAFDIPYDGLEFPVMWIDLPVGDYQLNYIIADQGWIRGDNVLSILHVIRENIVVSDTVIFTTINSTEDVTFSIFDDDGNPVAAYVTLTVVINGDTIYLGNGYANADGLVTFQVTIPGDWDVRNYTVTVAASNGANYRGYQGDRNMYVKYPVLLEIKNLDTLITIWSQGINLEVQAYNSYTDSYIGGLQIMVVYAVNEVNPEDGYGIQYFEITNIGGTAIFQGMFPWLYYSEYPFNAPEYGVLLGKNSHIYIIVMDNFEYQTTQLILDYDQDFFYQSLIVDPKIHADETTLMQTLDVDISLESNFGETNIDYICQGENTQIQYNLFLQGTNRTVAMDTGELGCRQVDDIWHIYYQLDTRGQWELVLTETHPLIDFRSNEVIVPIGWNKTMAKFNFNDGDILQFEYGQEQLTGTVTTVDGRLINNIDVYFSTPFVNYDLVYSENGSFTITLAKELYIPSNTSYKISLSLNDPNLLLEPTDIDIYIKINYLSSDLEVNIPDFYVDQSLNINFQSDLNQGNYSFELLRGDKIVLKGDSFSEEILGRALESLSLSRGNYTLKVWRADMYYSPNLQIVSFQVIPIPVSLTLNILEQNSSKILLVQVIDQRTNKILDYQGEFNFSVSQNGEIYSFSGKSGNELNFNGNFTIAASLSGDFYGYGYLEVTDNIVVHSASNDPFQIPEIALVLGVMILGFGVPKIINMKKKTVTA